MVVARRCVLVVLGAVILAGGCVERKLLIRSAPPGGVVLVDNKVVGVTPLAVPFTFYGERTVEVRWDPFLPGVEPFLPARQRRYLYPPWYQYLPLDFFFEHCWPWTITDERVFFFQLKPRGAAGPGGDERRLEEVIRRAEALRARTLRASEEDS